MQGATTQGRLIIVSNRLPFVASEADGRLTYTGSSGGVATGLSSYLDALRSAPGTPRESLWVGWPGNAVADNLRDELQHTAESRYHSHPVFLSREDMEKFYLGFCNKTLWPLFHYFPTYATFDEEQWKHYRHVNAMFADSLLGIIREGDVVWIHDYHLMLLPGIIRARAPNTQVGFFLHIPFPSFEIFRMLPSDWRREILEGILGADLVGFHTFGYMQHFLQCVLRLLGHDNNLGQIALPNRVVKAETFPMGIEFGKFHNALSDPEVQKEVESLRKSLPDTHTVLSVDRLDYTKGILNRLHGFELLLEEHPKFRGKVVLILLIVPSRIGVDQYEQAKKQIEELVGSINGKFGGISWTPVIYQFRNLAFEPLVALYNVSDVALVTPLRDGMNLVAKEYVASRADRTGVLIISEMAGAAKELGEAIQINPHYVREIARALHDALEMPVEEQQRRNLVMQNRLRRYDVTRWATDFLEQLSAQKQLQRTFDARVLPAAVRQALLGSYRRTHKRLVFLDYDGTLVPFAERPHLAKPDEEILGILRRLSANPANTVVIISGRDRTTLTKWFGHLPLQLVAEHGAWLKSPETDWAMFKPQTSEWKPRILPILEQYADRLPGSFVEEKEHSLVWHYRAANPEHGEALAAELTDHLVTFTANIDVQVVQGHRVIEVRNAGVNKGAAGLWWIMKQAWEFMLAVGDDWTDEDLFAVLPPMAYSIRVGVTSSRARFNLRGPQDVVGLLKTLAQQTEDSPGDNPPGQTPHRSGNGSAPAGVPARTSGGGQR